MVRSSTSSFLGDDEIDIFLYSTMPATSSRPQDLERLMLYSPQAAASIPLSAVASLAGDRQHRDHSPRRRRSHHHAEHHPAPQRAS